MHGLSAPRDEERALGKLGGLIRRMPWVAWLALLGTLAIAGVPPLNGFVSEWLLLGRGVSAHTGLAARLSQHADSSRRRGGRLTAALAGYVMVKFYGVVFLGQPREEVASEGPGLRTAGTDRPGLARRVVHPAWRAARAGDRLPGFRHGAGQRARTGRRRHNLRLAFLLAPINAQRASYSPLLFLIGIALSTSVAWVTVRKLYHGRVRRAPAWTAELSRCQTTAHARIPPRVSAAGAAGVRGPSSA